jgi:hypothetical protein
MYHWSRRQRADRGLNHLRDTELAVLRERAVTRVKNVPQVVETGTNSRRLPNGVFAA